MPAHGGGGQGPNPVAGFSFSAFMKIKEMTREELRDYMKASREILSFDADSPTWKRAFQLAKQSGNEHWNMECSKCIQKVQEWVLQ